MSPMNNTLTNTLASALSDQAAITVSEHPHFIYSSARTLLLAASTLVFAFMLGTAVESMFSRAFELGTANWAGYPIVLENGLDFSENSFIAK